MLVITANAPVMPFFISFKWKDALNGVMQI